MIVAIFISFSIKKVKFGRYYRDFSSYLNDELSSGSMLIGKMLYQCQRLDC